MVTQSQIPEVELTKSALFKEAEQSTGFSDWGDRNLFEPGFDKLLAAIENDANLNHVGKYLYWLSLVRRLSQRLLLQANSYSQSPLDVAERPALVVIGMPRSGTTLLQRLLALDSKSDALRYSDVLLPVPPTRLGSAQDDAKILQVSSMLSKTYERLPDLLMMHELEPRTPDEELFLLEFMFVCLLDPLRLHIPTYWDWVINSANNKDVYWDLKQMIAYVGKHRNGSHWVLKTPHHIWMLGHLLDTFPNAHVIWTHRDPVKSVSSFCSLSSVFRRVYSDTISDEQTGSDWFNMLADGVSRATAARELRPDGRVLDIQYRDLMRDPIATVRTIYEKCEMEFPDNMPNAMEEFLSANPKGKYGNHVYSPETFGLSADGIKQRFSNYIVRYQVETEPS